MKRAMNDFQELDRLSSQELHDRAVSYAERHLDVKFFWDLLKLIPAAEAARGSVDEARDDIQHPMSAVADAMSADDGSLADALRPFYIDYLERHPEA
jgi:hypothetical protein